MTHRVPEHILVAAGIDIGLTVTWFLAAKLLTPQDLIVLKASTRQRLEAQGFDEADITAVVDEVFGGIRTIKEALDR